MLVFLKSILLKIILVLIALVFIIAVVWGYFNMKTDNERLQRNIDIMFNKNMNDALELNREEFQSYLMNRDTYLDSVIKANNIKVKNIEKIIENKYYYNYDTTIVINNMINGDRFIDYRPDSCIHLKALITKDSVQIDTLIVDYNSTDLYYSKRLLFGKYKIFKPFGKVKIYKASTNNCRGTTTTKEIIIE